VRVVSGIFAGLLFFGALFWAREQDPFSRKWFTLKTTKFVGGHNVTFKCVAVLPKPRRQCPVIIYAHSSGGDLMDDGTDLRQMAELGIATVSLEYNQTNEVAFNNQFEAVLRYIGRQKWANTNAMAWVGFSLGANRMWDYALQHPEWQPRLLVQLSGAGIDQLSLDGRRRGDESQTSSNIEVQLETPHVVSYRVDGVNTLTNLRCSLLLVHSDQDEVFPVADTKRLVSVLQTNGLPVELKIVSGLPHGMEPDREEVFRGIGEYCLTHLTGGKGGDRSSVWLHYRSIAQWQADAPWFGWFCVPAVAWVVGWFGWRRWGRKRVTTERIQLTRGEIALRWLAGILAALALTDTALHLLPPHFLINERTLALARKFLVQPKERADFETLAGQPIWKGQKLGILLEQVELANYNRELINWQLDDRIYRDFVLSPEINLSTTDSQLSTDFNWRRPLWEEFYPRIRHESSTAEAAQIVVRHLRERVTIADIPNPPREVSVIWRRQITDEIGFEIIYVAALRLVGVPARLDGNGRAEFWDGGRWSAAPGPAVVSW
jgi:dienelactone hydrolase